MNKNEVTTETTTITGSTGDRITDKTIRNATRSAKAYGKAAYIVPTYFGPRIEWDADSIITDRHMTVAPDGTVTMTRKVYPAA